MSDEASADQPEPVDPEALSTEGEGEPGDGQSWKREVSEPSVMSESATGDVPDPDKVQEHAEATATDDTDDSV